MREAGTLVEGGSPLVCDLLALDPAQRGRRLTLSRDLSRACQGVQELPDGVAFRFPNDPLIRQAIDELVTYERICCPFLVFTLAEDEGRPMWLKVTGPVGVTRFLQAEFGLPAR